MAYNIIANGGQTVPGIKEYVIDSIDDLDCLPKTPMGSTALIISTGKVYILDGSQEWKELK